MPIHYAWRGEFTNAELDGLHADGFGHEPLADVDWVAQVARHSLGWTCARQDRELVGFVNVAWDGRSHAFVIDTVVRQSEQRQGIGTELVAVTAREARAAGCEWLHVDFEEHLGRFYFEACGFRATRAGLLNLRHR